MLREAVETAPFVWRLKDQSQVVDTSQIGGSLIRLAMGNPRGVARLCFHDNDDSMLHVMVIGLAKGFDFPFHKHRERDETLIHIAGSGRIRIADVTAQSQIEHIFNSGQAIQVPALTWHGMSADSQGLAFLEIRLGPFLQGDTEFIKKPN